VIAGLVALEGVRHGGMTARVEALFQEVGKPERARKVLSARLKRGESLPGFGHPLYPQGDPRARLLIELAWQAASGSPALELAQSIAQAAWELVREYPTIDFALVLLSRGLGLPTGAPIALFALGRTVGWLAHAIEQYQANQLIRPRAKYVGLQPA
jgi:citrate synthase